MGSMVTPGGGQYTTDFPDSTMNTAQLSPADPNNTPLFSFEPKVATEFPDLADYEFLRPTLHIETESATQGTEEDLYQRIERRLRGYREDGTPKNGLTPAKLRQSRATENPFSPFFSQTTGKGLKKDSLSSGLTP
jgi:hypothetical protein